MFATMSDAHREWHRNAGVPMGTPGCPQDACHPPEPDCWECFDQEDGCDTCRAEAAAALARLLADGWVEVDGQLLSPWEQARAAAEPADCPF